MYSQLSLGWSEPRATAQHPFSHLVLQCIIKGLMVMQCGKLSWQAQALLTPPYIASPCHLSRPVVQTPALWSTLRKSDSRLMSTQALTTREGLSEQRILGSWGFRTWSTKRRGSLALLNSYSMERGAAEDGPELGSLKQGPPCPALDQQNQQV